MKGLWARAVSIYRPFGTACLAHLFGGDEVPDHLGVPDWLSPNVVELGDPPVEVPLGGCTAVPVILVPAAPPVSASPSGGGTRLTASPPAQIEGRSQMNEPSDKRSSNYIGAAPKNPLSSTRSSS